MPSTPGLPLGLMACAAQLFRQRLALPTKEYLMSVPPTVIWLCHPQYCVQKPVLAMSDDVTTK